MSGVVLLHHMYDLMVWAGTTEISAKIFVFFPPSRSLLLRKTGSSEFN
jgi:hypothetical protein